MLSFGQIVENIERAKFEVAAVSGGRSVDILGATKTQPKEVVDFVLDGGLLPFVGENRTSEFVEKFEEKNKDKRHFIGRLQTNKVKEVVGRAALIHSLDSLRLAEEIYKQAEKRGAVQDCLIEVNAGAEPDKGGVTLEALAGFYEEIKCGRLSARINIRGVMAVMPIADAKTLTTLYGRLNAAFCGLFGADDILCAGMSGDFRAAIEYGGSKIVRLGSYIFGERV